MTAGLAGASPIGGANPMMELQRRAFGLGGSSATIHLGIAVLGPIAAFLVCWGRAHGLVTAALVLIPTPALLSLVALRGRARWSAQDVLGWLHRDAAAGWRAGTGSRMPRNRIEAADWLGRHSETDVMPDWWAAALLMAGRVDEARERTARLPAETPGQLHRRIDLELAADAAEGRPIDSAAAVAAIWRDSGATATQRTADAAYHQAVAATSRGTDSLPGLAAARPALGRLPLGLALELFSIRFRFAAISVLFGAWLLVAILVAMASAGGVVWF
jgi:hypothetical protein